LKSHKKSVEGREDIRVITSYLQDGCSRAYKPVTASSFLWVPGGAVGFAELPLGKPGRLRNGAELTGSSATSSSLEYVQETLVGSTALIFRELLKYSCENH
jgi:hypothetical protein